MEEQANQRIIARPSPPLPGVPTRVWLIVAMILVILLHAMLLR